MPHSTRHRFNQSNNTPNTYEIRDFNNLITEECYSTPSILPACNRIIAIGDLHGDLSALIYALTRAHLIDSNGKWIGCNTIVVQVGDVLDRGGRGISVPSNDGLEEVQIFHYLYKLNKQARQSDGRVISLIGNHELMNMLGDFRYASSEHINGFGSNEDRIAAFKPGGDLAQKIACNSLAIVKIGDWIFVHGGLLPEHIETIMKNKKENARHSGINHHSNSFNNNNNHNHIEDYHNNNLFFKIINNLVRNILIGSTRLDSISHEEENLLFGGDGIFWTRRYSGDVVDDKQCNEITRTMNLLDMDTSKGGLVVGHTPQSSINSRCNNKIWRIDTAMSEAFGKRNNDARIQVLEIIDNGVSVKGI